MSGKNKQSNQITIFIRTEDERLITMDIRKDIKVDSLIKKISSKGKIRII